MRPRAPLDTETSLFADELRRAGHVVHTPDLFDGRTFETIDEGVGYAEQVGFGDLIDRGGTISLPRRPALFRRQFAAVV
ncbi:hypothetical protein [Cryobacterium sp. TMT1-66-1]|uniref:hypothetical protein n=1 Tax=Cryobacterium sp. TMT1-66-1 TaxID=1259242 RepID=UPI001F53E612|nr:hypothetical protein [Cryobacterium sp. TMT1-66-1]